MPVRILRIGGNNDDSAKEKKPKLISTGFGDINADTFGTAVFDPNVIEGWMTRTGGFGRSRTRERFMDAVNRMAKGIMDGSIKANSLSSLVGSDASLRSTGKTKKRFFTGNYKFDDDTINSLAARYVLDTMRGHGYTEPEIETTTTAKEPKVYKLDYNSESILSNDQRNALNAMTDKAMRLNTLASYLEQSGNNLSGEGYTPESVSAAKKNIADTVAILRTEGFMDNKDAQQRLATVNPAIYTWLYSNQGGQGQSQAKQGEGQNGEGNATTTGKKMTEEEQQKAIEAAREKDYETFFAGLPGSEQYEYSSDFVYPEDGESSEWMSKQYFDNGTKLSSKYLQAARNYLVASALGYDTTEALKAMEGGTGNDAFYLVQNYLGNQYGNSGNGAYKTYVGMGDDGKVLYIDQPSYDSTPLFTVGSLQYGVDQGYITEDQAGKLARDLFDRQYTGYKINEDGTIYSPFLEQMQKNSEKANAAVQKGRHGMVLFMQDGGTNTSDQYIAVRKRDNNNYNVYGGANFRKSLTDRILQLVNAAADKIYQIDEAKRRGYKGSAIEEMTSKADGPTNAELVSLGADIASILTSFTGVPILPGVLGLASTGSNIYSRYSDDGRFSGKDLVDTAIDLGFNIAQAIPGLGAAASVGKFGKFLNTVKKFSPLILTGLQGKDQLQPFKHALDKALSGQDLTKQDWVALAEGAHTALMGASATRVQFGKKFRRNALPTKQDGKWTFGKKDVVRNKADDGVYVVKTGNKSKVDADGKEVTEYFKLSESDMKKLDSMRYKNPSNRTDLLPESEQLANQKKWLKDEFGYEGELNIDEPIIFNKDSGWKQTYRYVFSPDKGYKQATTAVSNERAFGYDWINSNNKFITRPTQTSTTSTTTTSSTAQPVATVKPLVIDSEAKDPRNFRKGGKLVPYKLKSGGTVYKLEGGSTEISRNPSRGTIIDPKDATYGSVWNDTVGRWLYERLEELNKLRLSGDRAGWLASRRKLMDETRDIQESYRKMNNATGFGWNDSQDPIAYSDLTAGHQQKFNDYALGANEYIHGNKTIIARGNTGDNIAGNSKDGINSYKTSLRNYGYSVGNDGFTESEMYKKISDLAAQNEMGYDIILNDNTGGNLYGFTEKAQPLDASIGVAPNPKPDKFDMSSIDTTPKYETRAAVDGTGQSGQKGPTTDVWGPLLSAAQMAGTLITNKKAYDAARDFHPVLESHPLYNAKVYDDYVAQQQAEKNANRTMQTMRNLGTSQADIDRYMAANLAAQSAANDERDKGAAASAQRYYNTLSHAIDVANMNATMSSQTFNTNMRNINADNRLKANMKANYITSQWANAIQPFIREIRGRYEIARSQQKQAEAARYQSDFRNYQNELLKSYMAKAKISEDDPEALIKFQSTPEYTAFKTELENKWYSSENPLYNVSLYKKGGRMNVSTSITKNLGLDSFSREFFKNDRAMRSDFTKRFIASSAGARQHYADITKNKSDFFKFLNYAKNRGK